MSLDLDIRVFLSDSEKVFVGDDFLMGKSLSQMGVELLEVVRRMTGEVTRRTDHSFMGREIGGSLMG